jgi:hypothetical protein
MQAYNVSETVASLGLALYVLGCERLVSTKVFYG